MPRRDLCPVPDGRLRRGWLASFDETRRSAAVLIASSKVKSRPTHLCRRRSPERRMRWSFRIFREEYLTGSYVCQVEPLSKPSLLRVPGTPPGDNLPCVPHAGGVSFWRMTRRSPRSPGRVLCRGLGPFGRSTEPATEHLPPAKEGSIDADVLEPVQIAGERIFSEHDHVRDLADLQRSVSVLVPG